MSNESSELTAEDQALLAQVQQLGAATAIEVAVKTLRQPGEVRTDLEQLYQAGLLKVRRRDSDYERNIYLLTPEGRQYAEPAGRLRRVEE